jgi:hypothetical protein
MKKLLSVGAILLSLQINAQISFNTGNAEMDKELNEINTIAKTNLEAFKSDLALKFKTIGTEQINKVLTKVTAPAEALMVLEIQQITKKPLDTVLTSYDKNKSKGWGAIAKDLGIKPGSAEFHQLKANMSKDKPGNGNKGNGKGNGKNKKK